MKQHKAAAIIVKNTLINKIYGVNSENLINDAKIIANEFPSLSKKTELGTKYSFWIGIICASQLASPYIGSVASNTFALSHPFLVSSAINKIRKFRNKVKEKKETFGPNIQTYNSCFSIIELASIPLSLFMFNELVKNTKTVSIGTALLTSSLTIASLCTFEYVSFRFAWKKAMGKFNQGSFKDEVTGFKSEFNPFRFVLDKKSDAPKSSSEYVGQLFGILYSYYFWAYSAFVATSTIVAGLMQPEGSKMLDLVFLYGTAFGRPILNAIVGAANYAKTSEKIEENNSNLGII